MTERQLFEQYARKNGYFLNVGWGGRYENSVTHYAWQSWKSGREPLLKKTAELEHALNYVVSVYMVSDYSPDQEGDTQKTVERLLSEARKALEGKQ